jgi:hypothetical protein
MSTKTARAIFGPLLLVTCRHVVASFLEVRFSWVWAEQFRRNATFVVLAMEALTSTLVASGTASQPYADAPEEDSHQKNS